MNIKKYYCFFLIVLFIPSLSFADDLFLINPSFHCKKYLTESFSSILKIDDGVYKVKIVGDELKVKKQSNYKFEYLHSIQGKNAFMIISKVRKELTGTLTIMDSQKPCRTKITKNSEIFKNNYIKEKNITALADNKNSNQDNNNEIKKLSAECTAGHVRIENKCIKKEFLEEFENQLNNNIEILKKELANLNREKQKKEFKLKTDTEIPFIGSLNYSYDEHIVTINGVITDNYKVSEAFIDDELLILDENGIFETTFYIPRNGKELQIIAFDLKGNKSTKTIKLSRQIVNEITGPFYEKLNPSLEIAKENSDALALIIGISNYEKILAKAIYADNDAKMFYDYATFKLGIPNKNIKELINNQAGESDILLSIKDWISRMSKRNESDIFIFFAGHGMTSAENNKMYIIPYDSSPRLLEDTAITKNRLLNELSYLKPRSVTIFFDTCFSGSTRSNDSLLAARPVSIVPKDINIPDNFLIFSAAGYDEIATPLDEVKHGMFSYYLMKGMEGYADKNKDKKITSGELHNYVQENVLKQTSGSQKPDMIGSFNKILIDLN